MSALTPLVLDWFAAHHGVASLADLDRLGVTMKQRRNALRARQLIAELHGVYRLAGTPRTASQAAAVACAANPDVAVSHISAGRHWGLRGLGRDARLHVLIPGQLRRQIPNAVIHRTYWLEATDVVSGSDGIRFTSPPRTVFDLASMLTDERLESVIEQVLHDGLAALPALFAISARLRHRGRKGSDRIGRVLAGRPAWLKPVDSDLELRVERAIISAGLPRPVRQYPVQLPNGETFRLDFYWPDVAEALEVDHITWHGGKLDLTADKRRDRMLRRVGIRTTRITDDDVQHRLPSVIADLRAVLRPTHVRSAS
jgi:very-short-patch-repair endonuclease